MKIVRMKIDPAVLTPSKVGRIDKKRVDSTTEKEITSHKLMDETEANMDAAKALLQVLDKAPEAALAALH